MNFERFFVNFPGENIQGEYDLIIVGSGVAGLTVALYAPSNLRVAVFSRGKLNDGSTYYAQGGIAVALGPDDSVERHIQDTLSAGAGLNEKKIVEKTVTEGIERVEDLISLGFQFDKINGELAFTKEGAHSRNRIIHSGGDATGKELETALIRIVSKRSNVKIFENYSLIDLITNRDTVVGGAFLNSSNKVEIFLSRYFILATGGAGQIYRNTTNPEGIVGNGLSIALRAGARLMDLEFYQFHPTTLKVSLKQKFLISETVRSEGGVLINKYGERFMPRYSELADLAPRDIVTRAILDEAKRTNGEIFLNLSPIGEDRIHERFPTIYSTCKEFGFDITKAPIPIEPSAHYFMGGIETDEYGRTSLKNLFACGEVACTGLHGANRLGSNSLLECLVFGKSCADAILADSSTNRVVFDGSNRLTLAEYTNLSFDSYDIQQLMWDNAGIIRSRGGLEKAIETIEKWQREVRDLFSESKHFLELKNMLVTAYLMAYSALAREESRGAHYRLDFPDTDDKWLKHIVLDRDMGVIYRDVNTEVSFKRIC
jgi:L-aspartate oxidase